MSTMPPALPDSVNCLKVCESRFSIRKVLLPQGQAVGTLCARDRHAEGAARERECALVEREDMRIGSHGLWTSFGRVAARPSRVLSHQTARSPLTHYSWFVVSQPSPMNQTG